MRSLTRVTAAIVASIATSAAVHGAQQSQSSTIIGPSNPQLAAGATALDSGRIQEGIELTLDGLRTPSSTSDRAAGHSNLCAGYAMLKQWDLALQHCNTSLQLDKYNWRTFNNRAAVYSGKGQYDLAVKDIRAGLEIAPRSTTLRESLRIVQQNKRLVSVRSRSSVRPP